MTRDAKERAILITMPAAIRFCWPLSPDPRRIAERVPGLPRDVDNARHSGSGIRRVTAKIDLQCRDGTSARLLRQGLVAGCDQADPDVEGGQPGGVKVLAESSEAGSGIRPCRVDQHPVTRGRDAHH